MLKSRLRRFAAAALALAFVAAVTSAAALAAPAVNWSRIEVRLVNGQTGEAMLVAGQLSDKGQLPAAVKLAAPTGQKLDWAGEILGGDVSKDPAVQYTTVQKPGYDEIGFTLTKSARGQIEYTIPDALATNGANQTATLNWTSPVDVPEVLLAIQVPSGAKIASDGGGQPVTADGASFYEKTLKSVKAGQKLSYQVAYSGGSFSAAGQSSTTPQGTGTLPTGATSQAPSGGGSNLPLMLIALGVLLGLGYFGIKAVSPKPVFVDDDATPRRSPAHDAQPKPTRPRPIKPAADDFAFGDDVAEPEPEAATQSAPKPKPRKRAS